MALVNVQNCRADVKGATTSDSRAGESDATELCDEALALIERGNYEEAHERLMSALSKAPQDPLVHYRLGVLYGETRRLPEALDAYALSIALNASDPKSHNNRGSILQRLGRLEEATSAFQHAIELDPDLALPYINLGNLCALQGRRSDAITVFQRAVDRGLDKGVFEQFIFAISGSTSPRSPDSWVQATFDNFAPLFDEHLRSLGYEVPEKLADLLRRSAHGASLDILDLGCGTGLCGLSLAQQSRKLVGVDLSPRMLALADQRGIYDELHQSEIHAWLRGGASATLDAVVAADVFIYIGALEELFSEVARVLRAKGWFLFSIEQDNVEQFTLRPSGRYAHSVRYVEDLAAPAFKVIHAEDTTLRMESGAPIKGRLFLLQRN